MNDELLSQFEGRSDGTNFTTVEGGQEALRAAIASCPGRGMDPNPCRCPCYPCKHHCSVHNPNDIDWERPAQPRQETP